MKSVELIIRADASIRSGTGHVMRMIALGQAWSKAGGSVTFVSAELTPALKTRLNAEAFNCHCIDAIAGTPEDAVDSIRLAADMTSRGASDRWIVADGYAFGADYQRAIKNAGLRLLIMDDYGHAGHYYADLVINQNLSAHENLYKNREPYSRLLLGTRYVLLRKEFLAFKDWQRIIPQTARKVLVTLGGSDPDNVTGKVIEILKGRDVEVIIIAGGSNPHLEKLRSQILPFGGSYTLVVDAVNMSELISWADMAISAAGSTSWELAFMGLPCLMVILAENQRAVAEGLHMYGNSVNLGWHNALDEERDARAIGNLLLDQERRQQMSRCGQMLVDGCGSSRVVKALMGE